MGIKLRRLSRLLYELRPPQHAPPIGALTKDESTLEYKVFSSELRIRATVNCNITFYLKYPVDITVLGGLNNNYKFVGDPEVLANTKITYYAGSGNSIPTNLGEVIIQGGDNLRFY